MAKRYWTVHENMGYAGTDLEEEVDALDWLGISEEELAEMTDSDVQDQLVKYAWESAVEKVDVWAEPTDQG